MHLNFFLKRFSSAATASILIFSTSTQAFAKGFLPSTSFSSILHKRTPTRTRTTTTRGAMSSSPNTSSIAAAESSPPKPTPVLPGTSPVESQPTLNPIDETCTVLVVGGTRGIGLEFVSNIANRGATVIATYRSDDVPSSLKKLKENHPDNKVHFLQMDVESESSIQNAALEYKSKIMSDGGCGCGSLTHIIHNAGIYLPGTSFDGSARGPRKESPVVTKEVMMKTFEINSIAPLLVAQNFVSLMTKRSDKLLPVLSFLTSKVGSIDDNGSGGAYAYRSSKSALNNIAKSLSVDLGGEVSVVLLHPGWVRTDMTGGSGLIDADETVEGMLKAIEATDATIGFRFVDYKGCLIPW